jgi:tRNA-specific 2-thiouridylase
MTVGGLNLIKYAQVPEGLESVTKIRYKDAGALSTMHPQADGKVIVEFSTIVRAIAPGQSAVFYEGDDLIGGGIIHAPVAVAAV